MIFTDKALYFAVLMGTKIYVKDIASSYGGSDGKPEESGDENGGDFIRRSIVERGGKEGQPEESTQGGRDSGF